MAYIILSQLLNNVDNLSEYFYTLIPWNFSSYQHVSQSFSFVLGYNSCIRPQANSHQTYDAWNRTGQTHPFGFLVEHFPFPRGLVKAQNLNTERCSSGINEQVTRRCGSIPHKFSKSRGKQRHVLRTVLHTYFSEFAICLVIPRHQFRMDNI